MNIDGITILNQTSRLVHIYKNWHFSPSVVLYILLGIIIFICGAWFIIYTANRGKTSLSMVIAFASIILPALLILNGIFSGYIDKYDYKVNIYTVIIDDTVSFNSVLNSYNIVSQDGKIFVIEDKIPEN